MQVLTISNNEKGVNKFNAALKNHYKENVLVNSMTIADFWERLAREFCLASAAVVFIDCEGGINTPEARMIANSFKVRGYHEVFLLSNAVCIDALNDKAYFSSLEVIRDACLPSITDRIDEELKRRADKKLSTEPKPEPKSFPKQEPKPEQLEDELVRMLVCQFGNDPLWSVMSDSPAAIKELENLFRERARMLDWKVQATYVKLLENKSSNLRLKLNEAGFMEMV